MSRAAKIGLGILGSLALMAGMAWIYQNAILLELAEMPVNIDKTLVEPDARDDEYIYWPN